MCVSVIITLPSRASSVCMYVCICMLTPLNDCDYIRQYFTVNYEILYTKNDIFHTTTPCNLLSSPRKGKNVKRFHLICQLIINLPSIIREA